MRWYRVETAYPRQGPALKLGRALERAGVANGWHVARALIPMLSGWAMECDTGADELLPEGTGPDEIADALGVSESIIKADDLLKLLTECGALAIEPGNRYRVTRWAETQEQFAASIEDKRDKARARQRRFRERKRDDQANNAQSELDLHDSNADVTRDVTLGHAPYRTDITNRTDITDREIDPVLAAVSAKSKMAAAVHERYGQAALFLISYVARRLNLSAQFTIDDPKKVKYVFARLVELQGQTLEERVTLLLYAVDGAASDDWVMGRNGQDPHKKISHIFRSNETLISYSERTTEKLPIHPVLAASIEVSK